jgi:nucleoid-associated protein YgaU
VSIIRFSRALLVLLAVGLGSAVVAGLAAPVVVAGVTDLTTPGAEPAEVVGAAVTLTAAAALAVVACWAAVATAWCVVAELLAGGVRCARQTHPLLRPWLVRVLVGAALGTTALAAPATAASTDASPRLPHALAGLPLPDRPSGAAPAPAAEPAPAPAAAPAPAPAPAPTPSPRTHTVAVGESLWGIAADRLPPGAPSTRVDRAWRDLYDANRFRLGDDPDLIRPGTVLRLPRPLA